MATKYPVGKWVRSKRRIGGKSREVWIKRKFGGKFLIRVNPPGRSFNVKVTDGRRVVRFRAYNAEIGEKNITAHLGGNVSETIKTEKFTIEEERQ